MLYKALCYTTFIVVNNIPEILSSRKATNTALVIILVLLGLTSFGLGKLSEKNTDKVGILECTNEVSGEKNEPKTVSTVVSSLHNNAQYVASRNGTKYHFPWCSGAKRIKAENLIYFKTKEDAERAGYGPASNCKGL